MSNLNEQSNTIVINDLLSFMACKVVSLSRSKLLPIMRDHYTKKEADTALETFLSSLPSEKLPSFQRRVENEDPFTVLYDFLSHSSPTDLPIFVCQNLNNIPNLDHSDTFSYADEGDNDLVNEQKMIKSQISELSTVVYQLRDQIGTLLQNKVRRKSEKCLSQKKGLAYLQKLIDQEEEMLMPETEIIDVDANKNNKKRNIVMTANPSLVKDSDSMGWRRRFDSDQVSLTLSDNKARKAVPMQHIIHIENIKEEVVEHISETDDPEIDPFSEEVDGHDSFSECEDGVLDKRENESEQEKFPFISVEQVFDENVGHFSVYKCSLCNFSTNDASAVHQHDCPQIYSDDPADGNEASESKSFRYFCFLCRFKCNSKPLFKRHNRVHPQSYPCPFCPEKLEESEGWMEHVLLCVENSGRNPKNHVCPVCNIVYANAAALQVHKGFHDLAKPFECLKCRYRFYTQETLDKHFKAHVIEGFKCPFCHFVNKNKTTLGTHLRCHTGEMPFACQYCNYRSTSQSALNSHALSHSDKKPLKCDECDAYFKSVHKLNVHKITHMKNKEHKCPVCMKRFKTGWLMTFHHQRVHLNIRNHSCKLCDYKARSLSALKSHLNTHSNAKSFKCHVCDFRANHKSHLKRHISSCHPDNMKT